MSSPPGTFCVYPFSHLNLTMEGKATLCCRAGEHLTSRGRPLSLYTESFEQIWNSGHMQSVRRDMLAGKRVAACEHCYRMEESGGTSLRQMANEGSDRLLGVPVDRALERASEMVAQGGAVLASPASLHLWLGNLCNLKCRMCNGAFSSQIAADPVHSKWSGILARELLLLPDYVPGVEYSGFGELEAGPTGESRAVFVSREATIVLPGNGDPIVELELSGVKATEAPLSVSVRAGSSRLVAETVRDREWNLSIRPEPPLDTGSPICLALRFEGADSRVAIRSLRLVCRGALGKAYPEQLVSRLPPHLQWAESREVVIDELLARPERLRHISFAGGEPMLNPHLGSILSSLVDSGDARHISLFFSSNGTVYSPQIVQLLNQFESVGLAFSLDGVGALQEYIRPPAKWETVWKNVVRYGGEPMGAAVHTTPQAYNVFGLLDLIRLAQRHNMAIGLNNVLYAPRWLSLDMLPQPIVNEALGEWEEYRERECPAESASEVDTLLGYLRRPRPENIAELQEQFVGFTRDLDRSRSQSLALANPRLHDRLVACGIDLGS